MACKINLTLSRRESATTGGGAVIDIINTAGHLRRKDRKVKIASLASIYSYGYSQAQDARNAVALVEANLPASASRQTQLAVLAQTYRAKKTRGVAIAEELIESAIMDADAEALASLVKEAEDIKAAKAAAAVAAREVKAAADAKAARKAARDAKRAESSPGNVSNLNPAPVSPVGDVEVSVPVHAGPPTVAEILAAIALAGPSLTVDEWRTLSDAVLAVSPV